MDGGLLVWDGSAARLTWLRPDGAWPAPPPSFRRQGYASAVPVDLVPSAGGVALAWSPSMVVPGAPPTTRVVFHPWTGAPRELAAVGGVALVPLPRLRMMVPQEVYGPLPLFAVSPGGTLAVSDGTVFRIDLTSPGQGGCCGWSKAARARPYPGASGSPACRPAPRGGADGAGRGVAAGADAGAAPSPQAQPAGRAGLRRPRGAVGAPGGRQPAVRSHAAGPVSGKLPTPTYTWELFAPDGRRLAAVQLDSRRFTPRAFAGGRVFGTYRLADGEDAVAVGDLPAVLRNVPPRAGAGEQGRGG